MKKILIILMCLPLFGFTQTWEKTFPYLGHSCARAVAQTKDLGYIISGGVGDSSLLMKTDSLGTEQWSKSFFSANQGFAIGWSIIQTPDGGFVFTGSIDNPTTTYHDVLLFKTDSIGVEQWAHTFSGGVGGSFGYAVEQTNDGGFIISGRTYDPSLISCAGQALYLIKTDSMGIEQWSKSYTGTTILGNGESVSETDDGGYIVSGSESLIYLLKVDSLGTQQWFHTFTSLGMTGGGYSVKQTTDGGYMLVGQTFISFFSSISLYLLKTDSQGFEQWSYTTLANGDVHGYSAEKTSDGGYIVTGLAVDSITRRYSLYLTKINSIGIEQWSKFFVADIDSWGLSVSQTVDDGFIIAGCSYDNNFTGDIYLIKTDSLGNINVISSVPIPIPNEKGELQKITNYLGQETNPVKNTPLLYQYENGTVEKKIIIE